MPVRTHFSKTIAIMCTFLASGLVHEWILTVVFYIQNGDKDISGYCNSCFHPYMYGKNLMFFLWNGILIGLEFTIAKRFFVSHHLNKTLPSFVVTFLVLMFALPVAHWFFGDILKSKYFHQSMIGLHTFVIRGR